MCDLKEYDCVKSGGTLVRLDYRCVGTCILSVCAVCVLVAANGIVGRGVRGVAMSAMSVSVNYGRRRKKSGNIHDQNTLVTITRSL